MKENREVTDTNVEDIEEALEKLSTGKKIKLYELLRTFKREGIENFVTTRKKYVDVILSDYKRVLKENAELKNKLKEKDKIIDLMAEEISKNITNTCPFADYNYDLDCENKCNDNYKECWKQYFENKVKEG